MFMCPQWEHEILTQEDFHWTLWDSAADFVAEMVNRLQMYPVPTDDVLEELKKRVDIHYQDKNLDLDMRCGWRELTEDRYTTLVKKLQGERAKQAMMFVNEIIDKQHN
ncbi:hypothetical protein LPJ66_003666 [Kickxella alabastrina]|uniref:Uncharacterized protein n=1 Tax=Kickxella alabastrina TaxID=61397 RepID=A0ACC1IMQ9_9FUNG|nr:hypothetical protein LPJ66_003666 [Kickxella alabastrina]